MAASTPHAVRMWDHAHGSPSNYTWVCGCGEGGHVATSSPAFAIRSAQAHLAHAVLPRHSRSACPLPFQHGRSPSFPSACWPSASACRNRSHDHLGQLEAAANGTGLDTGDDRLVCGDCHQPMHYDYGVEDYRHDDLGLSCFLIRSELPAA